MGRIGFPLSLLVSAIILATTMSSALADPNLKILTPSDGAVLSTGASIPVKYEIKPDPGGDHSHIYVNHKEAGILRRKKATFTLDPLPPGEHSICLKVVNKAHAPIGQSTCIMVTQQ
ncbi:MAG: hypothetical protein OEZ43_11315 [Gammaproteobacteria bacterium]|nr:hypothetical protein [Gammaproteobacteria bacterium]